MASFVSSKNVAILALALAFCVQGIVGGGIECENLNKDSCAFAVSSTGKRCVLDKSVKRSGEETYTCRASEIEADKLNDYVETDRCIDACGLERSVLGISSDSLLEPHFLQKLCSDQCYNGCPNIVDLYFNLAAGEGVFLPKLCEAKGENGRRGLAEFKSSGHVAPGPLGVHLMKYAVAPEPEGGHPVKYMVAPAVAPEPEGGHPVKYMVAPVVAPEPEGGYPTKYMDAPVVAPEPEGGYPTKYMDAPVVAPEPEGGHPVKYEVAPVVAPSPYEY